ncbi:MAG: hypothetical protein GY738_13895 [Pseudoalteromonas sp.]|nr:hypothetical protein [Pseudoalteromonas sp.]
METKFTKGEWIASCYVVVDSQGDTIADCGFSDEIHDEKEETNAALIAAAPEMYAMLERLQLNVADEIERDELLKKARDE